ncbi:MAG: TIGR02453 family protein [Candidatus Latescibacterota bacterium]
MADHNPYITPRLFQFLRDLRQHNDRAWFQANRQRYEEEVRGPLLAFIDDFAEPLYRISPHFRAEARKVGGSLFRIFRDVRFASDKSPYKTNAGVHFRHENARDAHAPGFYLHLEPGEVFMAAGIWHPERAVADRVRAAIVEHPDRWQQALASPAFRRAGFYLGGDSYRRPPAGYDRTHPCIDDVVRKDFIAVADLSEGAVCAAGFPRLFAGHCQAAAPLVRFLAEAVGQPF